LYRKYILPLVNIEGKGEIRGGALFSIPSPLIN